MPYARQSGHVATVKRPAKIEPKHEHTAILRAHFTIRVIGRCDGRIEAGLQEDIRHA